MAKIVNLILRHKDSEKFESGNHLDIFTVALVTI